MTRFCRFELRTTDVVGARAFYKAILDDNGTDIVPLPAEVLARGARPHWLGHIGVADVERAASAFVARGATRLGPTRSTAYGQIAIVRDPGGAVVAVATAPDAPPRADVVWHVLNTATLSQALDSYPALFGWQLTDRWDLGPVGVFQQFAWQPGGPNVGAVGDIAGRPGVHPHWLFHFRVPALDPVAAAVRAAGGLVLEPIALPSGARVAVCDNPQGAAFALMELPPTH